MRPPPDSYLTLGAAGRAELRVRRSRFVAVAAPADDDGAARALVDDTSRRHHAARHVCSAWRLGPPPAPREIRHDAGEPAGTAGEPILAALRAAGLTDVVGVVVRYFGGVKLGTGGLARAYGEATAAALAAAPRRRVLVGREFAIVLPYALQAIVRNLLAGRGGHLAAEEYAERVTWRAWLPRSRSDGFAAAVRDATAGRAAVTAGAARTWAGPDTP